MTREELKPGRELDALVAEKVMGLNPVWGDASSFEDPNEFPDDLMYRKGRWYAVLYYSTNIAAAWEVVGYMSNRETVFKVWRSPARVPELWYVELHNHVVEGLTAPHAICLAALKVVGAI